LIIDRVEKEGLDINKEAADKKPNFILFDNQEKLSKNTLFI
jgi:hypothetical protein